MAAYRHVAGLLTCICCAMTLLPSAGAWSNGGYSADPDNPDYGTHDWIADMALDMQTRDVTFLKTTYHAKFLLGTEAPDNPEFIGDTFNHHVYFTSTHLLEDDACALRAEDMYQLARDGLEAADYDNAAYYIGAMAHYIADPGVFGHTMGAYTDWGAEVHHSDYENEVDSRIDSLPTPAGFSLADMDAYNATIFLAENITFGNGQIQSNVWMDSNYNWTNPAFVTSTMASLNRSVSAVAASINHLIIQAGSSPIPTPPSWPTNLYAAPEGSHIVLTWGPPADNGGASITSYTIYRKISSESLWSRVADVLWSGYTWTDETVSRGKIYYYSITANNIAGQSQMSSSVLVEVPNKTALLTLPIIISAASIALASGGALLWRRRSRSKTRR